MALAIDGVLKPLFSAGGQYEGKVKVIFRNQVQPWHASSTLVHEAGLAVGRNLCAQIHMISSVYARLLASHRISFGLSPLRYASHSSIRPTNTYIYPQLFKQQGDYFDIPTSTLTPIQIREKLASLAASVIGGDKSAILDILTLKSSPNGGIAVTDDLKYTSKFIAIGA